MPYITFEYRDLNRIAMLSLYTQTFVFSHESITPNISPLSYFLNISTPKYNDCSAKLSIHQVIIHIKPVDHFLYLRLLIYMNFTVDIDSLKACKIITDDNLTK